jgi:FlaA1/EpsC-like NDP-sugar epimerase
MKKYNILKLAEQYKTPMEVIGIREGEKLLDKLWSQQEGPHVQDKGDYYVIK